MQKLLAIELASPFVKDFAVLLSSLIGIDANRDGKISIAEGFSVAQLLAMSVLKHYSNVGEVFAELKDADSTERKELIQVFAQGFELPDNEIEEKIEATLLDAEEMITRGVQIAQRWNFVRQPPAA